MEPTFYQHVIKQRFSTPQDAVEIHAMPDAQWAVCRGGEVQSVRGKWHRASQAQNFWKTHTYSYDEAVNRARNVLQDNTLEPMDSHIQVSLSTQSTGIDLLSVHLLLQPDDKGYVASTTFGSFIDATGRQARQSQESKPLSSYVAPRQEAFKRAVTFLVMANINGSTIHNSGSAILERR